jgi:hypothetical protein
MPLGRRYWRLKGETLDGTVKTTRLARRCGPVGKADGRINESGQKIWTYFLIPDWWTSFIKSLVLERFRVRFRMGANCRETSTCECSLSWMWRLRSGGKWRNVPSSEQQNLLLWRWKHYTPPKHWHLFVPPNDSTGHLSCDRPPRHRFFSVSLCL